MAKKRKTLKIFALSQPLLATECIAIMGDKYRHALPFDFEMSATLEEASVIAWDGVITVKLKRLLPEIISQFKKGKVFLMMGEARTLYQGHPFVEVFESATVETVQLTGWSVLPEDLLAAFELCHQKSVYV